MLEVGDTDAFDFVFRAVAEVFDEALLEGCHRERGVVREFSDAEGVVGGGGADVGDDFADFWIRDSEGVGGFAWDEMSDGDDDGCGLDIGPGHLLVEEHGGLAADFAGGVGDAAEGWEGGVAVVGVVAIADDGEFGGDLDAEGVCCAEGNSAEGIVGDEEAAGRSQVFEICHDFGLDLAPGVGFPEWSAF